MFFVGILLFAHFIVHGLLYTHSPTVLYCLHLLHSTEMSHLLYIISICTPSLFLTYLRRFVTTSVSLSLLNYSHSNFISLSLSAPQASFQANSRSIFAIFWSNHSKQLQATIEFCWCIDDFFQIHLSRTWYGVEIWSVKQSVISMETPLSPKNVSLTHGTIKYLPQEQILNLFLRQMCSCPVCKCSFQQRTLIKA